MKIAEQRMKKLQKCIEYGRNYQAYKLVQDKYRQIRWKGKQENFEEARRAELTLWNAANRYLYAHLPEGVKTLPISAWDKEYAALKAQRKVEYAKLKGIRSDLSELQSIRRCGYCAESRAAGADTDPHQVVRTVERTGNLFVLSTVR